MSQQPIIRVRTEAVKAAIERYVEQRSDRFTTADIALFMGGEEYPVRAAMTWLIRSKMIEIIPGVRSKRYFKPQVDRRLHSDGYSVSMYRLREPAGEVDFAALNRLFGYA